MSKGNKNSRVGFGMKPRGVQENQADEPIEPIEDQEEVSVDEGQPDSPENEELDGLEGPLDSSTLEAENAPTPSPSSVLLLEEGRASLAKLMSDPGGNIRITNIGAPEPQEFDLNAMTGADADKFRASLNDARWIRRATADEVEAITGIKRAEFEAAHPTEETPEQRRGERGDGTFGMVVAIPEGYIDIIRDQAESDGITPEAWMNIRVQEIMETWWEKPKGR